MRLGFILLVLIVFIGINPGMAQTLEPENLKVENLSGSRGFLNGFNAVGGMFKETRYPLIRVRQPFFSWEFQQNESTQAAYQIQVSEHKDSLSVGRALVWDSGLRNSGETTNIPYSGGTLKGNTSYFFRVRSEDRSGRPGPWSGIENFKTAPVPEDYAVSFYPLEKEQQRPATVEERNGVTFIDFGKDAFGQLYLTLSAKTKHTIEIRLGEALNKDGSINRKPGGTIRFATYEISLLPGRHSYRLLFTPDKRNTGSKAIKMPEDIGEVLPFRYVEIEGLDGKVEKGAVLREMVHYPFNREASSFNSSDSILNKIWELSKYSIKATSFTGYYVDGDRERIPYEADTYINQLSHYAVDQEYTMARRSLEYLIRNATWPTEWNLQVVLIAYNDYLYTGDIRLAKLYYEDLKAKLLLPLRDKNQLISTRTGKQTKAFLQSIHFNGDSLQDIVDWPHRGAFGMNGGGEDDGFVYTKYNTVVNAFHYKALKDMEVIAGILGKEEDAQYFKEKARETYNAFQQLLWDKTNKRFKDGVSTGHASLHANMFALAFDLVPERDKKSVVEYVKSRGMACSVYGSQFLLDAIYNADEGKYGLSLLASQSDRSWYNMLREGSTITMEAWGNQFKPNQDWNHAWGAAPANIISRKLMGVEPLLPGWEKLQIKPQLGDLKFAEITVPTIKGAIEVSCERGDNQFKMTLKTPGNTSANLLLPALRDKRPIVRLNGEILKDVGKNPDYVRINDLPPGHYQVEITY